jgi:hypothetical protein
LLQPQDDIKIDFDIHMDSDFGSLFGVVKEEQKTSPEQPGRAFVMSAVCLLDLKKKCFVAIHLNVTLSRMKSC